MSGDLGPLSGSQPKGAELRDRLMRLIAGLGPGALLPSERVLAGLAQRIGKHRAQELMHEVLRESGDDPVAGLVATLEHVAGEETLRDPRLRALYL